MSDLYRAFPRLAFSRHRITSPKDIRYNCIAWAAGDARRWWEPDPQFQFYWPAEAPREYSIEAYFSAYQSLGFEVHHSLDFEAGVEKVALFALGSLPTHAARQLPDGAWTSKCGALEDLEHELPTLEGSAYGRVALILGRPRKG